MGPLPAEPARRRSTSIDILERLAQRFYTRFVPPASANNLAAIRILVFSLLLISALWEDLPSTVLLPAEMREPIGVVRLLYQLPIGFREFHSNLFALLGFQALTRLLLALGVVGLYTRLAVPLGAIAYCLFSGILREYSWFYHTGLVPLYLALGLSFMPCGDAWSIDRWRRSKRGRATMDTTVTHPIYGWCRYTCWVLVAVPYVLAGLSKLRNGSLLWWTAANQKHILFGYALEPMHFEFHGNLLLRHAPDAIFTFIGLATLTGELGFGLVLFSRQARRVMPPLMAGMHLGILFVLDILFYDLIVIQLLMFRDWKVLRQGSEAPEVGLNRSMAELTQPAGGSRTTRHGPFALAILGTATLLVAAWAGPWPYYPLSAWDMFASRQTSGYVTYFKAFAEYADGTSEPARFDRWIGAMADTRYRQVLRNGFGVNRELAEAFLSASMVAANSSEQRGRRTVTRFVVEQWAWDCWNHPRSATIGTKVATYSYPRNAPDADPVAVEHQR
jgi:hypothetical protein